MLLEIVTTTDRRHVGTVIETGQAPIRLDADETFAPDRVWPIGPRLWRLANPNYVIDAKEA